MLDLANVRALADAATDGPWTAVGFEDEGIGSEGWQITSADGTPVAACPYSPEERPNAEFIAAARELVPAMADEIERLRRELAKSATCRATLDDWACELPNGHNGPHFRVNPSSGSDSWWPVPPESLTAVGDEQQPTEDLDALAAAVAGGEGWPVEVEEK